MNQGNIIGRLTRDLELTKTQNDKTLIKGGLAVTDKYNKEKTHFFNFTAFGKTAEIMAQYLTKGSQVGLTYSLNHNTWQDKEGNKKSTVDLLVSEFTFTGTKGDSQGQLSQAPKQTGALVDFGNFDSQDDPDFVPF